MKWSPPESARFSKVESGGKLAGILAITSFTGDAAEKCRAAAQSFKEWNVTAIVVDLRGNPGGRIDVFAGISGLFLGNTGSPHVDKQGKERLAINSSGAREMPAVPVAVLVDGATASAAEVFAAVLKESARAGILAHERWERPCITWLASPTARACSSPWAN